jgi:hypothetical protein
LDFDFLAIVTGQWSFDVLAVDFWLLALVLVIGSWLSSVDFRLLVVDIG